MFMDEERKYKTFVFVVDGDIFHTFRVEDTPYAAQLIAGMQSGPLVIDVTGNEQYSNEPGWKFLDGKFVRTESLHSHQIDEDDYEVE